MTQEDIDNLRKYGICPSCWAPRCPVVRMDEAGAVSVIELGCTNPECDPSLIRVG